MPDKLFKNKFWLTNFIDRLIKFIQDENLTQQEFNQRIGVQRALTRWKAGETSPSINSCLAIKKAFNKSLDWIILGESPTPQLQEFIPEIYDARQPAPVDVEKIAILVAEAEKYQEELRLRLPPARKGKWIAMLYEHWITEKTPPDRQTMKAYLTMTHV